MDDGRKYVSCCPSDKCVEVDNLSLRGRDVDGEELINAELRKTRRCEVPGDGGFTDALLRTIDSNLPRRRPRNLALNRSVIGNAIDVKRHLDAFDSPAARDDDRGHGVRRGAPSSVKL